MLLLYTLGFLGWDFNVLHNQLPFYMLYFRKSAASEAVDCIHVRIRGVLEKLRLNSVVMSVSTFVQQPGHSTLGILPGFSRRFSLLIFSWVFFLNCLPGGIGGFDATSELSALVTV